MVDLDDLDLVDLDVCLAFFGEDVGDGELVRLDFCVEAGCFFVLLVLFGVGDGDAVCLDFFAEGGGDVCLDLFLFTDCDCFGDFTGDSSSSLNGMGSISSSISSFASI